MRVARVIGTITLSSSLENFVGGRFLIVQPESLRTLRDGDPASAEPIVAYDETSAGLDSQVAISEGREASAPFHPRLVPVDAYCAAILDHVHVDRVDEDRPAGRMSG